MDIDALSEFEVNPPGDDGAIKLAEGKFGVMLPLEYKSVMLKSNGGEGFVGPNYLILWPVEDLHLFNQEYEVQEYAPGLLLFGSSGGGEAYAFDLRREGKPVVKVPFVGMDLDSVLDVSDGFYEFIKTLCGTENL